MGVSCARASGSKESLTCHVIFAKPMPVTATVTNQNCDTCQVLTWMHQANDKLADIPPDLLRADTWAEFAGDARGASVPGTLPRM